MMKLRNKKTGEIGSLTPHGFEDERIWVWIGNTSKPEYRYNSLAELNEEWEDYEEPKKKYWFIDAFGNIVQNEITNHYGDEYTDMTNEYERQKQIGNYFETKEEAEKAVEKLKAWKRLKDGGFTIRQWRHTPDMNLTTGSFINIKGFIPQVVKNIKDLNLLFGGDYEQ